MAEALEWTAGAPWSPRFGDIYFSPHDGLAESRAVFLQGCGLPQAWAGRDRFVVGELGFGTGLNVLALLELWARTREPGARLHVFSVEAFPLGRGDAARALAAWPELALWTSRLCEVWPDDRRGFHRAEFPEAGAILDLFVGEAADALAAWTGRADAWFLDGFAPSKNPEMWRDRVLQGLAARSAPGARLATFTVAGAVRRALAAAGFEVEKRPGFGGKRERLEGRLAPADPAQGLASTNAVPYSPRSKAAPSIVILGAGIAGAALSRAFHALGAAPRVVDGDGPGAGASGNPAALVTPRLDAGFGAVAELHAQAFARAAEFYRRETPDAVIAQGALQLETAPRDAGRFDAVAAWPGFASGAFVRLDAAAAAARIGEAIAAKAIRYRDALTLEPSRILSRWIGGVGALRAEIASLRPGAGGWRLLNGSGEVVAEAEIVCLAMGATSVRLTTGLPLRTVRGQLAWTAAVRFRGEVAAWGGYALPTREGGVLFGATHDRDDEAVDLRPEDDARNLRMLAKGRPALARDVVASLADAPLQARAALRAATPDHLPLAGAVPEGGAGLYILSGLGGRGFSLAPLLAEHVAAMALGAPSPLPSALADAVDPARFARRGREAQRPRASRPRSAILDG